jgi:competence protein ComEA
MRPSQGSPSATRSRSARSLDMHVPRISRGRALAYVAVLLVGLTLAGRLAFRSEEGAREEVAPALLRAEPAPVRKLLVHVVGAVREPGLYRLDDGSRIDDAVRAAGGPRPKAALDLLNLAAPVADGQQVIVPVRGRGVGATGIATPGSPPVGKVHLNTATLEELDTLPGVGPVTAQKIIDYRTEHGAFGSIEELDAVPGIGPARLAELTKLVDL